MNVGGGLRSTDNFQNLIDSSLDHPRHFQKISSKFVHKFLRKVVNRQTDKQTNKRRQKQYLLAKIMIITITIIIMKTTGSVREREEIERQLAPNEIREDQEEQIERPNSQDEDSHSNTPAAARSYEAKGNIGYLDKTKEWMQLGSERTRIPSLKIYNKKNLKEKTKEVNNTL